MCQLVSIIDENGLIDKWCDFNFDGTNVDHIFDFATAWSEFYPQLAEYSTPKMKPGASRETKNLMRSWIEKPERQAMALRTSSRLLSFKPSERLKKRTF
jgi:hypothetical protein